MNIEMCFIKIDDR